MRSEVTSPTLHYEQIVSAADQQGWRSWLSSRIPASVAGSLSSISDSYLSSLPGSAGCSPRHGGVTAAVTPTAPLSPEAANGPGSHSFLQAWGEREPSGRALEGF